VHCTIPWPCWFIIYYRLVMHGNSNIKCCTHMPFDHQVLYPLHDKGWALRNQLWEHSYCLGSTSNILAWCCGHLGICSESFCHFTKLCFCSWWCKIRLSPFVMCLVMDRILYQTQMMNEYRTMVEWQLSFAQVQSLGRNLSHCQLVQYTSHIACPSTEPAFPLWQASD